MYDKIYNFDIIQLNWNINDILVIATYVEKNTQLNNINDIKDFPYCDKYCKNKIEQFIFILILYNMIFTYKNESSFFEKKIYKYIENNKELLKTISINFFDNLKTLSLNNIFDVWLLQSLKNVAYIVFFF